MNLVQNAGWATRIRALRISLRPAASTMSKTRRFVAEAPMQDTAGFADGFRFGSAPSLAPMGPGAADTWASPCSGGAGMPCCTHRLALALSAHTDSAFSIGSAG